MPAKGIVCTLQTPSVKKTFDECRACTNPCMPDSFREWIFSDRPLRDKFSITQLQKPTRVLLLELAKEFYFDIISAYSRLRGSLIHQALASHPEPGTLHEKAIIINDVIGHYDLYDPKTKALWDYKNVGAYKIKKILADPDNELTEYKTQLSFYARGLKEAGLPVEKAFIWLLCSDWNAGVLRRDKIVPWQKVPIKLLPDELIEQFVTIQLARIEAATTLQWAPHCTSQETWEGKRCTPQWCPTIEYCQELDINDKSKDFETLVNKIIEGKEGAE